jgi:long-chain acyl-CoA synthetase
MATSAANFLERIFRRLDQAGNGVVLQEVRGGKFVSATGSDLLRQIASACSFLRQHNLNKGERCVLIAANSVAWVAMDLAIIAEGLIVVPLYSRQATSELVSMMKDCSPAMVICGDCKLRDAVKEHWPEAPQTALLTDALETVSEQEAATNLSLADSDPITIIYTSGTSGEAKGVVLGVSNLNHMFGCTSQRLDMLMAGSEAQDRVFHYLPFCFAGSWIMLLTCLLRGSLLMIETDLNNLATDMRAAGAHYLLNVPVLLERMRSGVDDQLRKTGGFVLAIYERAKASWLRQHRDSAVGNPAGFWLGLARKLVFPTIRKKMIGGNLRALICGSAPLASETQLFFMMLGIPVLQVYGLTETTAICTMDDPRYVEAGRVGPAIPGVQMKQGENGEILVRGPNIFKGYWNHQEATANVMSDGWFRTGDQGEVNEKGNWRISGRVKNLIILSSGHNVAPEPIEDALLGLLPEAHQVVLVGSARGWIAALVTGNPRPDQVQWAVDEVNRDLPHYKRVRAFHIIEQPFSIENGLLTANGKMKRDLILSRFSSEIEDLYRSARTA